MSNTPEQLRLAKIYERLRERLLDLSRRNPMLNYKHRATSKRQLQIVDVRHQDVYRRLVGDSAPMDLLPLPDPPDVPADERTEEFLTALAHAKQSDLEYLVGIQALESEGRDDELHLAEAERKLRDRLREQLGLSPRPTRRTINPAEHARENGIDPAIDLNPNAAEADHPSRQLHTLKWSDTLNGIMEKISDDARLAEQEMGISTLFLAFGFLEWHEREDSQKKNFAPLLLLPVAINRRKGARGKITYSLTATAEGADTNLSLRKLLQSDFDLELPSFEEEEDNELGLIEKYFSRVTKTVKGLQGWQVRRWLTLGHFSFGRFVMYADLEPENWPEHPVNDRLISPVLTGTEMDGDGGESILSPPDDYEIDEPEIERFAPVLIHDADASQHSVLVDAMKGKNLVVQGPPGTGKSQTITNIIANALAQQKTILFLAEKQAALEVVKRRLDKADLGAFCLELHSGKAAPRQVIESLKARHKFGYKKSRDTPASRSEDSTWVKSRKEIGNYLNALHDKDVDGESTFSLIWQSIRTRTGIGSELDEFRKIKLPTKLVEDPAYYEALKGEVSLYARMCVSFTSQFGSPATSVWSSIEFGGRAGPAIAVGLLEDLIRLRDCANQIDETIQKASLACTRFG